MSMPRDAPTPVDQHSRSSSSCSSSSSSSSSSPSSSSALGFSSASSRRRRTGDDKPIISGNEPNSSDSLSDDDDEHGIGMSALGISPVLLSSGWSNASHVGFQSRMSERAAALRNADTRYNTEPPGASAAEGDISNFGAPNVQFIQQQYQHQQRKSKRRQQPHSGSFSTSSDADSVANSESPSQAVKNAFSLTDEPASFTGQPRLPVAGAGVTSITDMGAPQHPALQQPGAGQLDETQRQQQQQQQQQQSRSSSSLRAALSRSTDRSKRSELDSSGDSAGSSGTDGITVVDDSEGERRQQHQSSQELCTVKDALRPQPEEISIAPVDHATIMPPPAEVSELLYDFRRVIITTTDRDFNSEMVHTAQLLQSAIALRQRYVKYDRDVPFAPPTQAWNDPLPADVADDGYVVREVDGVFIVTEAATMTSGAAAGSAAHANNDNLSQARVGRALWTPPSLSQFYRDLAVVLRCVVAGPAKSYCYTRLRLLEAKFNLHIMLNEIDELARLREVPHRDFYNVRKVDTHIHHSASMNAKHLQRFIKAKLKAEPNKHVIVRNGQVLTLKEVFDSLRLTPYDISVDTLDVHADRQTFHRFEKFNLKYNPVGESRLREIFLKSDNYIGGSFLAELTRELIANLEASKYQCAEYRISIYGRKPSEWEDLANWVCRYDLYSAGNLRWLIQVPRLYSAFRAQVKAQSDLNWTLDSYGQLLENIFKPLFDATLYPQKFPHIAKFLRSVVGFDCVDDESIPDKHFMEKHPPPRQWTRTANPPYSYYLFYLHANIQSLNALRRARGLNTLAFRPHCGEAGDVDHLACAFLTADAISHGINLRRAPVLEYLFYLQQIGIAMSPLSNNSLFLDYQKSPFREYFARGLNVSLSTDDPLQFHYTKEPLVEEYAIASQVWKLSVVDQCEIARNSVLQSGFEREVKQKWLGPDCLLPGPLGNQMELSNVPGVRACFRHEMLIEELSILSRCLRSESHSSADVDELLEWYQRTQ